MDDEARVLGAADLSVGNARSYWLDACEDISCDDFIHNFVDFGAAPGASLGSLVPEPTYAASNQDDSGLDDPCFFGGIDQILDSIKNGGGLPSHCGSNGLEHCSATVPKEHSVLSSEITVSNGWRYDNYGNEKDTHHVAPTAVNGNGVKHIKGESSSDCKRNDWRYGSDRDPLDGDESCGNGKRARLPEVKTERRGRQRPLGRKRPRDWDDLDSGQRDQVRRREQRYSSSRKDRDWKEGRGYWERDKEKNEMVYRLGSWEADRHRVDKMPVEKSCQSNGGTGKKPVERKEAIKLPEEQVRQYQLDVLEQAKKKNTIAFLETGAGKTLIAVLLIKSVCSEMQRQNKKMLAVFLVPKVPLVYQQAEVIRERTAFQVGHYCGEMGQDFWDARRWQREFETKQVVLGFPLIIGVNLLSVTNLT